MQSSVVSSLECVGQIVNFATSGGYIIYFLGYYFKLTCVFLDLSFKLIKKKY